MADGKKLDLVFGGVKIVDDAVIPHSHSKRLDAGQAMMRVGTKILPHRIEGVLQALSQLRWQPEKIRIEIPLVNLLLAAHPGWGRKETSA